MWIRALVLECELVQRRHLVVNQQDNLSVLEAALIRKVQVPAVAIRRRRPDAFGKVRRAMHVHLRRRRRAIPMMQLDARAARHQARVAHVLDHALHPLRVEQLLLLVAVHCLVDVLLQRAPLHEVLLEVPLRRDDVAELEGRVGNVVLFDQVLLLADVVPLLRHLVSLDFQLPQLGREQGAWLRDGLRCRKVARVRSVASAERPGP